MSNSKEAAARLASAYATNEPTIDLGRAILSGEVFPEAVVKLPLSMFNRHGLIAGATGTGKTKTLQLLAEQLSDQGVSVFAADVKGDLSGLSQPGEDSERVRERVAQLGAQWASTPFPVNFLSLGGIGAGVPVRASVQSFGPQLLAKILGSNKTQTSSLSLVFSYAERKGLPLISLTDVRAVLMHLTSDEGKPELKEIGGLSTATAGVLLRSVSELEQQEADAFFGEPELRIEHLLEKSADGKGIISCLELAAVQDRPKLFSTFLMWLLVQLFKELPEVGDLDKPKLVFFFDEAHLLFDGASPELREQVAQTVRLIRSKGVGVFFVTQLPDDVPDEVLAQLGNRVQHALRAFTPRDAKALKAAVTTYPNTDDYELEDDLTRLGTGEAMITALSSRGAPTPVVWTRLLPPRSLMAAIPTDALQQAAEASPLWPIYSKAVDRDSAEDQLAARAPKAEPPGDERSERDNEDRSEGDRHRSRSKKDGNPVMGYLKSREGRQMANTVVRGVFSLLRKRR